MNERASFLSILSTLVTVSLMFAAPAAVAAQNGHDVDGGAGVEDNEDPALSATAGAAAQSSPNLWSVRIEGSMVAMRDSWLSLPAPEMGLTVGRDLTRSLSIELTGSAREATNELRRSWSTLAVARWVAISTANGRHGFTVAGGPFLQVNHVVHGTIPFAHAEVAYVYRAPFGLTVLAGFGPNIALANSSYVAPPRTSCDNSTSDAFVFCLDFGPDAQELHVGDAVGQMRLAVGWQF